MNLSVSFWIAVAILVSINGNLLVWFFLAYKRLDFMERLLKNCSCIGTARAVWGGGPIGRMQRLNMVAIAISFPELNHKRAIVDLKQIAAFPKKLKRCVQASYIFCMVTLLLATIFGIWLKFR